MDFAMEDVVAQLRSVNWCAFFSFLENEVNTDPNFNTATGRFKKEEVISSAIQAFSANKLVYVNQQGHDFLFEKFKIEWKTQKNCIYTPTGKNKKNGITTPIKLKNTLRDDSSKSELDFDYLVIMDTGGLNSYSVYVIDKQTILDNNMLTFPKDGISIRVPVNKMTCIVDNQTIRNFTLKTRNPNSTSLNDEWIRLINQRCSSYVC